MLEKVKLILENLIECIFKEEYNCWYILTFEIYYTILIFHQNVLY